MEIAIHLVFPGNCEEAFNTYKEIFNGKIVFVFRKGEDNTVKLSDAEKDKISHIILATEGFSIQGEDADSGMPVTTGSSKLVLLFRDLNQVQKIFDTLSQSGTVVSPLEKTFFSEAIGEVIDRFGTRWLIMMTDEAYGT